MYTNETPDTTDEQKIVEVADFIVKNGMSCTTNGEWSTSFSRIAHNIVSLRFVENNVDEIFIELRKRDEVLDVMVDGEYFDVAYHTHYCPKSTTIGDDWYEEWADEYEDDEQ
jgi:hypothetical protein